MFPAVCLSCIERVCRKQDHTLHNQVGKKVTVAHDSVFNAIQASVVMATFSAKDRISRREAVTSLYIFSSRTVLVWQHGTV